MADSTSTSGIKRKASDSNFSSISDLTSEASIDQLSPFLVETSTSSWTVTTLDKLKIKLITTVAYTPTQLISEAYKELFPEIDKRVNSCKERILDRSPLQSLDVDDLLDVESVQAFKLLFEKSVNRQYMILDAWDKSTGNEFEHKLERRLWHMFHIHGEQFAQQLIYMSIKQKKEPPTEFMYQFLFQHFAGLLGLSFLGEPQLCEAELKIGKTEVTSTPDIIFPDLGKSDENVKIVAICEVKKDFHMEDETSPGQTSTENKNIVKKRRQTSKVVNHLDENLLGQLGGELLLHLPYSTNQRGLLGIVVQKTYVTFCYFDCTKAQFDEIKTGSPSLPSKPVIKFSKQYNFLKSSDREELIEPFVKLGFIQCMPFK